MVVSISNADIYFCAMSFRNIARVTFIVFFQFSKNSFSFPEEKITTEQYVIRYKDNAIIEMEKHGIPASITLAQAILESGNGNSELARKANNHFGIKCHNSWKGKKHFKDDDKKDECFRKYESVQESYSDHSLFLTSSSRYVFLFQLDKTDYKSWAKGLKKAGYATNPKYDEILIRVIETHELYKFDSRRMSPKSAEASILSENNNKKSPSAESRTIYRMGIRKYIIIQPTDDIYKIAKDMDKDLWQLYKYNDLSKGETLISGQKLFLQPKRNKADEPYHKVKQGETMKYISQFYGVKLKKLYTKNNMVFGDEPKPGDLLYLRKKKSTDAY